MDDAKKQKCISLIKELEPLLGGMSVEEFKSEHMGDSKKESEYESEEGSESEKPDPLKIAVMVAKLKKKKEEVDNDEY